MTGIVWFKIGYYCAMVLLLLVTLIYSCFVDLICDYCSDKQLHDQKLYESNKTNEYVSDCTQVETDIFTKTDNMYFFQLMAILARDDESVLIGPSLKPLMHPKNAPHKGTLHCKKS